MLRINQEQLVELIKATLFTISHGPDEIIHVDTDVPLDPSEVIVQTWVDDLHSIVREEGGLDHRPVRFAQAAALLTLPVPYAIYGEIGDERVDMMGTLIELIVDFYGMNHMTMDSFLNTVNLDDFLEDEPILLFN